MYASDYGYDHGFVWFRGHFTATGSETGMTLTADGISPTGAYSVWLNGAFLGSGPAAGAQTQTVTFPVGAVKVGADNVIAVLVENTGNPEMANLAAPTRSQTREVLGFDRCRYRSQASTSSRARSGCDHPAV